MNIEKRKILFVTVLVLAFVAASIYPALSNSPTGYSNDEPEIKNVIMLVPDGCSLSVQTIARWYKGGLYLDSMQKGSVSTWAADSVITDSASAATAFATGHKTDDKFISVGPKSTPVLTGFTPTAQPYVPLATVLEGAKLEGKATGLVATSTVSHATPACFGAHTPQRDKETEITKQLVYQDIDVVFGGGFQNLINNTQNYTTSFGATWTGVRDDGQNLYKELLNRGYQFVDSRNGLLSLSSGKAWGLFATGTGMAADINRQYLATTQPSLAEMTSKAIELLSQDKDGFFLMVEGSQVDWGDHFCDVAWSVGDFMAFDEAVGVALNFAQNDGETLVMAFPDHNTGGLTLGNYYQATNKIGHVYTSTTIEDVVNPLKGMKINAVGLTMNYLSGVTDNAIIKAKFKEWWSLDITDSDIAAMKTGSTISNFTKVGEYIDKTYTVFGWTTAGHTGDDVPLWAYGPTHNTPTGHYDNTDLAKITAEALDFRLSDIQDKLYVKVSDVFKSSEWKVDLTDSKNPVLEINYGGKIATLPTSKDQLTLKWNGQSDTYLLDGIVVYCPDISAVYIPREAVNMIKYPLAAYSDPSAVAWNVDSSFSLMDILKANHTFVPADKVANPVQKLTISYDEKPLTCNIKVGGVTYSLGKDFNYTGHVDFIYYNPSFNNPTLGYLFPSSFSGAEITENFMYNFSAVPGGLEGTLSMLATSKDSVSSIVSVGGTGDFKNVEVKATISPQLVDAAKMVVNTYFDGMVSGWPHVVPVFMTTNYVVTYAQLTDYCVNVWGLSSNPYPTFPANVSTEYHIFNIVIGDKFYLMVGYGARSSAVLDPVAKTVTLTYNDTWYLGDSFNAVAKMDQGFKGTMVVTFLNYTPANATATPPTPSTYVIGPAMWNLQGFGALSGQSIMVRADGPVLPFMAKGYAVLP